jgi:non-ribosomal peptide synthase protein (TIGR01720 family)
LIEGESPLTPIQRWFFEQEIINKNWAHRLAEYAQSPPAQSEAAYWEARPWEKATPLPVDHSEGTNLVAQERTVTVSLSIAETQVMLREVPRIAQINVVLLTALAEAIAKWTGNRTLLIDLEGHGREGLLDNIDLSRTVGWFTSVFPVLLDVSRAHTEGDSLEAVAEQLRAVPLRGIGYGILRYLSAMDDFTSYPQAEVAFNYVGNLDYDLADASLFTLTDPMAGPPQGAEAIRSHLVWVNGNIMDRRLQLHFAYSMGMHDQKTIEKLAKSVLASLRKIIIHCRVEV